MCYIYTYVIFTMSFSSTYYTCISASVYTGKIRAREIDLTSEFKAECDVLIKVYPIQKLFGRRHCISGSHLRWYYSNSRRPANSYESIGLDMIRKLSSVFGKFKEMYRENKRIKGKTGI